MSDISLPIEQKYDFNGSIAEMEFNRLKEILEKRFCLKMVASCPNNEDCHIELFYSEDGSEEDIVTYVWNKTPEEALLCMIDQLSGNTVIVYKEIHTNITCSLLFESDIGPPLPNRNMFLYKTIHIPKFQTSTELKMKLELSA